ncbi:MAG TPA: hypothetical protein VLW17_10305 [Thermoanaerobaculaceae bacterium]|nr:hypothetical protein [Thermoanaerobaculaceae bacterium]
MPRYFCPACGRETVHLHVTRAAQVAQVTRATVYNWLKRGRLHLMVRASGMRFICTESLVHPVPAGPGAGSREPDPRFAPAGHAPELTLLQPAKA